MKIYLYLSLFLALATPHTAQELYQDYIGAGHSDGIVVSASSSDLGTNAEATIDGSGMEADRMAAARFLLQSSMGFDSANIDQVLNLGYEAWIDDQMAHPQSSLKDEVESIWRDLQAWRDLNGLDTVNVFGPASVHVHYAHWQIQMLYQDLLRQRMAFALSQIFVVSSNSDLTGEAYTMGHYYDMLASHAFGNYRDLLGDVTRHVAMGYYLSHLNNPKEDPANNIHPDENYAREIMQLFSIGLYELNNDGTRKLDNGDPIPTYDNTDIKELAKIFTGLGPGGINESVTWTDMPYFGLSLFGADHNVPMAMYQDYHETSEKIILKKDTIAANQPGLTDIDELLDILFNHPNVGPFFSRLLIQRLVKSNPTPAYIDRVATVFNDNGSGVRGDMAAVVKAILLDDEARSCEGIQDPSSGRLIEPLIRYIHMVKAIGVDQSQGRYYNNGYDFLNDAKQQILASPTVFNFYLPDHQPVGDFADNDMYGPEYKLHNSSSAITYINKMIQSSNMYEDWETGMRFFGSPWWDWEYNYYPPEHPNAGEMLTDPIESPLLQAGRFMNLASTDIDALIDKLDVVLMRGETSDHLREDIRDAVREFNDRPWVDDIYSLGAAIQLMIINPDYNVTH